MGAFFSNLQIKKTDKLNTDAVAKAVSTLLTQQKYKAVPDKNEADICVVIYSGNAPWISVCSDGMEVYDDKSAEAVLKPLSAKLDTDVLAISCFDSDYLFLNLINDSENLNAWANIGHNPEGHFPRRTVFSSWKSKVSDIDRFKSTIRAEYEFAEDVLSPLESILNLPAAQGSISESSLDEFENKGVFTCLYFSLPDEAKRKDPAKLAITRFSLTPCKIGEDSIVTAINTGGSSRGLAIAFTGEYVENEEITFTDVKLEYGFDKTPAKEIPVQLCKREIAKGKWAYCAEIPQFLISDKVNPDLPPKKKADLESGREIGLRFTPLGDPKSVLDICVHLIPLSNPEGQCCWCVWHTDGSKEAYIKHYNARWKALNQQEMLLEPLGFGL